VRTKRAGESALLLLDVVDLLTSRKISYAVVGAMAAAVHAAVRASMDADVVVSAAMAEVENLSRACRTAGFLTELTRGGPDDPIPALLRLSDAYANRVDLLIGLQGFDSLAFSRLLVVPFQGRALNFIGREDFIAMKVFAGGPIDLLDARRAIAAAGNALDAGLARRLATRYGREAAAALEPLLARAATSGDASPPTSK